jgi:hypothetical protein
VQLYEKAHLDEKYLKDIFHNILMVNKKRAKLEGLENITEFLRIVFASGSLKNETPLSVLLVAPVSSGKTVSVKQFYKNKKIVATTDTTAYGILLKYQKDLEDGKISHFIIPDLLNCLVRRKTSVETLLMFINAISEDGLMPSKTFNMEIKNEIKPVGWVMCLTADMYEKKKKFLDGVGFLSRFFTVHWKYSPERLQKILDNIIAEDVFDVPDLKINSNGKKKEIKGNPEIFKDLIPYSKLLCKNNDSEVLRIQRHLQTFLKASALLRGADKVGKEDLETIKNLIDLIR